jgi:hypothetical protein
VASETSKGISEVIRSETELTSVVGRTQLLNPADLNNVKTVQAGRQHPASRFLTLPRGPFASPDAPAQPDTYTHVFAHL